MFCTLQTRPKGQPQAATTLIQFEFAGGYIGAILPTAKQIARQRKAVLVPFDGQTDACDGGPVLVDCRQPKNDAAEFLGVL